VQLTYTLSDPDNEACTVYVEYSTDGADYYTCAEDDGGASEGTTGLEASPTGSMHVFIWDSEIDMPGVDVSTVRVRITPHDTENGSSDETALFTLDNNDPPAAAFQDDAIVRELEPSASPGARYGHTIVYDRAGDRFVFFGGTSDNGATLHNGAWEFTGGNWTALTPSGTAPSARMHHTAIYDPASERIIIFGGDNGTSALNDAWALDLTGGGSGAWVALAPSGTPPSARYTHSAIYDTPHRRMIVYGGEDSGTLGDVHALDLSDGGNGSWTQLSPGGTAPDARKGHAAAYDPYSQRMLVFGGYTTSYTDEALALDLSDGADGTWSALSPGGTGPSARSGAASAFEPVGNTLIVMGGTPDGANASDETWFLGFSGGADGNWSELDGPFESIESASFAAAALGGRSRRMLLYGGKGSTGNACDITTELSLTSAGSGVLAELSASGDTPPGGEGCRLVCDTPNRRLILVTASGEVHAHSRTASPDGTWTRLYPSGAAPSFTDFETVLDTAHQRLVMFDSLGNMGMLDRSDGGNGSWTSYNYTAGAPSGRSGFSLAYDTGGQRMLLFGGNAAGIEQNDLWAYSLDGAGEGGWSTLSPSGGPPSARAHAVMVMDAGGRRAILFGGGNDTAVFNDVWTLDVTSRGSEVWSELSTSGSPSGRYGMAAVLLDPGPALIVIGGRNGAGSPIDKTLQLDLSATPSPVWSEPDLGGLPHPPIAGHGAAFDSESNDVATFGGTTGARNLSSLLVMESGGGMRETRSGNVDIHYNLSDLESDNVSITVEYSPDGGYAWLPATEAGGDGTADLASSPDGKKHLFVWASGTDLDNEDVAEAVVRITPSDAGDEGWSASSACFRVDNVAPVVSSVSQNLSANSGGYVIDVEFSENMSRLVAEDISNYSSSGGQPDYAGEQPSHKRD
jgi:hypothetical protein